MYDWKKSPDTDVAVTLKKQKKNTKDEFEERAKAVIVEFAQQVSISLVKKIVNHLEYALRLVIPVDKTSPSTLTIHDQTNLQSDV